MSSAVVARNSLSDAVEAVDLALQGLQDASGRVRVVVTNLDHIHAFVGSGRFKKLGPGERQQEVWDFLTENVDARHLSHLYRVEPMDVDEFSEFIREVQIRALSEDPFDEA